MKRHLLIIAVCLLLGAVVNIAVAWGCVERSELRTVGWGFATPEEQEFWENHLARDGDMGVVRVSLHLDKGFGVTQRIVRCLRGDFPDTDMWSLYGASGKVRAGWPLRSLHGEAVEVRGQWMRRGVIRSPRSQVPSAYIFKPGVGVVPFMVLMDGWRDLPFRPIWPSFLVNTLFYAALLWALIAGPFALRWLLRLRRGLCPKCAYPMGESSVCTECGGALAKRAVA